MHTPSIAYKMNKDLKRKWKTYYNNYSTVSNYAEETKVNVKLRDSIKKTLLNMKKEN